MWQKQQENAAAINDLKNAQRAARDAAAAARGQEGRGGFPPAPKPNVLGCPPNCGNSNPTGDASAAQVQGDGQKLTLTGIGGVNAMMGGGQ